MTLNLTKPICFFDIESTGVEVVKDRIIEISILKIFPNGNKESKTWLVNPQMPIPPKSTEIHGITDEKVANEPTFKELAGKIIEMIKDSDLAGYNSNRFDVPILAEELLRAGQDFDLSKSKTIDVQVIFHKMEQRTLTAAYKFYCGKDLTDAHTAAADTLATYEVLLGQLEKYPDLPNDISQLNEYTKWGNNVDFSGFVVMNDANEELINFGKYKGQKVTDVFEKDPGYYGWIQGADFPLYTKKVFTALKLKGFNK